MAFDNSGISGDLVIPNSVTEVEHRAFCLCSNLTGSLTLPDSMTLIDDYAFCSPFTGELVIPNSVAEIYSYAFSGSKFSSITIGENVTKIWQNAFEENDVIEKVVIPNSVVEMERWIFRNCTSLDTIVIGSGMVNMNDRCLYDTHPSNVTILAENPPMMEDLINDYTISTLIIPCGSILNYNNSNWTQFFERFIEDCDAVSELDEDLVTVYPNPTQGKVKIEAEGVERVSVYNVLGEIVLETESTGNIDLSTYGYGVYLIKVETRDGVATKKVRVE
ncbi:MAG: leucine-rich repeat domain-containing protein [Bacteroidales bacterium]|nr:leucine-rich repeat domain-containing protein [Bacteroidales bacterium]